MSPVTKKSRSRLSIWPVGTLANGFSVARRASIAAVKNCLARLTVRATVASA
jgi:hypothetical protein